MQFTIDHDLHIHSYLSSCSNDPGQSIEAILQYGIDNNLNTLCITDHMWDSNVPGASNWYRPQSFEHVSKALPLKQAPNTRFLFGCETDLDKHNTLGIARETIDKLDFVIIPTTHLHMNGFTCAGNESIQQRAELWQTRFDAVLDMDLPFRKIGIAHLTCPLVYAENHVPVFDAISDDQYKRIFDRAAQKEVGIELNFNTFKLTDETRERILRPYRIAKNAGCKFYLGSDAHHPDNLHNYAIKNFNAIVQLLDLNETDKFTL